MSRHLAALHWLREVDVAEAAAEFTHRLSSSGDLFLDLRLNLGLHKGRAWN